MTNFLLKFKVTVFTTFIMLVLAVSYVLVTPNVYLTTSRAAIFRMKVENPDRAWDEGRNRWIWIRDGLNVHSALLTDELFKEFIESNTEAKKFTADKSDEYSKLKSLRDLVRVHFTGADENNYIIEVKSSNKELALALNQHVFERLKFLAIEKDEQDFQVLLEQLQQQMEGLAKNSGEHSYYQDKLMKLNFEHTLAQTQKENIFQVIAAPALLPDAVWPKTLALLVIALIFGAFAGLSLQYISYLISRRK